MFRKSVQSFVDQVKSITVDDIHEIAAKILATPVTMASWGDGMNQFLDTNRCLFSHQFD